MFKSTQSSVGDTDTEIIKTNNGLSAMMEAMGRFCESPEEKPLTYCGLGGSERGWAKEGFLLA